MNHLSGIFKDMKCDNCKKEFEHLIVHVETGTKRCEQCQQEHENKAIKLS